MADKFVGYLAKSAGAKFEKAEFEAGTLHPEHVEIDIKYGGVCHSDLSMWENEWGISQYPFVGGHEAIGTICRVGDQVKNLKIGQTVGVGWNIESCMHCQSCISGSQQMCNTIQPTIVNHHGGFANKLRAHWGWTIPIPEGVDPSSAGPLMCGGITVFGPLYEYNVRPTDRVGVIGIGGLGHMALKFLTVWGCEVTAFTSSPSKFDEAKRMGAHRVIATHDKEALNKAASSFEMILVTANAPLEWDALINCLSPKGRLHIVGAVTEPISLNVDQLISRGNSVSASPTGSPSVMTKMLEFAGRHQLAPEVEHFPMSKINEAFERLKSGKVRYRIVLDADF